MAPPELAAEAWLDWAIPEPTPGNVRRLKRDLWRGTKPEGFRVMKETLGPDGQYHRDATFAGETAYDGDGGGDGDSAAQPSSAAPLAAAAAASAAPAADAAAAETAAAPGDGVPAKTMTWRERLDAWDAILAQEEVKEELEFPRSRFTVGFSAAELKERFKATKEEQWRRAPGNNARAFWAARRWWKHRPKMPYTWLLQKIANFEVEAAVYSEDLRRLCVTMKDGFPSEFAVDIPVTPDLYGMLKVHGVELDVMPRGQLGGLLRGLAILGPSFAVLWYIMAVQHTWRLELMEQAYDLVKMDRSHLVTPQDAEKTPTQYSDVVVGGDVWQVLEEIMTYMRDPMKYHSRGAKLPRGILISGPPGTGKTLLARAIARECGLPFVFASGAEFVESGSGTGSDKVFELFFTARANAPAFIFIDEIDALAGKSAHENAERRATFQQLLNELDGEPEHTDVNRYSKRQAVIMIGATNRPDELHQDLMKPGRIDREIHIGLPGEAERLGIFDVHSRGKRLAPDVNFSKLVFRTVGFSGADIRNLINEAGIMAVRKGNPIVTQADFVDVLDKSLFEGMGISFSEDELARLTSKISPDNRRLLAVHEAGHILLAHLFPRFDWHAFSHLLPGGEERALSVFYPRQEMLVRGSTTVGYLKMQMVVSSGGRCAERLVFGDENLTDGGQDDLVKISKIARELVSNYTSPRLGIFPMRAQRSMQFPKRPDEVELIPDGWNKPGSAIALMSPELSELFTREMRRYIDEAEDMAYEALRKNRPILEAIADHLYKNIKINGLEAGEIAKAMNPDMLPDYMYEPEYHPLEELDEEIDDSYKPDRKKYGRYEPLNIYPAPLHRG
eukprot:SM000084S23154  [mRNA]  locus=s84:534523:540569:+ [translate_table: standard]